MKRYVRASTTSGLIGIWWIKDDTVIADVKSIDEGYNDGSFINYDEYSNHSTEWRHLLKQYFPDEYDDMVNDGYKSLDRGRVVYNLRTQTYEVTCGDSVFDDIEKRKLIIDAFDLENCRCEFVNLGYHYHIAKLTGNPALDQFEYGV